MSSRRQADFRIGLCLAVAVALALPACDTNDPTVESPPPGTTPIPATTQRTGDPARGYDFLLNGGYIQSGVPLDLVDALPFDFGSDGSVAGRNPINRRLPLELTAVEAPSGAMVAAPNCLVCHTQELLGETVIGLGKIDADFTTNVRGLAAVIDPVVRSVHGEESPEWEAYEPLRRTMRMLGNDIVTDVRGANPAMVLFLSLIAHRTTDSAEWSDEPVATTVFDGVAPLDPTPWWHIRKKSSLYRTGTGRGDLAGVLTANLFLTSRNVDDLRALEPGIVDLVAWMRTIEPPRYPRAVDEELASDGQAVFERECSKCHGTYGPTGSYPNLLVDADVVGTDPAFLEQMNANKAVMDAFNAGPLGTSNTPGRLVTSTGYVAPPLDGIWASAPYLHNGSIPTVAEVLQSSARPAVWKRSRDSNDYDFDRLGWNYIRDPAEAGKEVYDTNVAGYGNYGHLFGDLLTDAERTAVIEYLKTL